MNIRRPNPSPFQTAQRTNWRIRRLTRRTRTVRFSAVFALGLMTVPGFSQAIGTAVASELPSAVKLTSGPAPIVPAPDQPLVVNMHNAADTPASAREAATVKPSMIEADVSWNGHDLVVDHTLLPRPFTQRAVELDDAWARTTSAPYGLIDAKMRSAAGVNALVEFAHDHRQRPLYVSTPDAKVLAELHARAPWVRTLLSLCTPVQLERVLDGRTNPPGLYGFSVDQRLLTRHTVGRLTHGGRFVLAYSVDDMNRIRTLADWGVRGITTDNCAIARSLHRESISHRHDRRTGPRQHSGSSNHDWNPSPVQTAASA